MVDVGELPDDSEVRKRHEEMIGEIESALFDGVTESDIREAVNENDRSRLAAYEFLGVIEQSRDDG